jgi:DNA-binding transcriptional LysR family regulator
MGGPERGDPWPRERDEGDGELDLVTGGRGASEITLRKLRAFWAIAHSESLTRAAKLLGVTQPTLSQQLTGLEASLGAKLFERRSNRMMLTEAGAFLLRKAEPVLRGVQELEDGLAPAAGGRPFVRLAGVSSVVRVLLPVAARALDAGEPGIEYDVQESAPAEILDMLYARRIHLGVLAANSVAEVSAGFAQVPLLEDPHVLVVPRAIDLAGVEDPERDLDADARRVLNSTIHFVFGNQHSRRVQDWYDCHLPLNRARARVRSYELALELVRAEAGVCIAPTLSLVHHGDGLDDVRLYRIDFEPRRIVAMVPSHVRRLEPFAGLLAALQEAAGAVRLPDPAPVPPFVAAQRGAFAPAP